MKFTIASALITFLLSQVVYAFDSAPTDGLFVQTIAVVGAVSGSNSLKKTIVGCSQLSVTGGCNFGAERIVLKFEEFLPVDCGTPGANIGYDGEGKTMRTHCYLFGYSAEVLPNDGSPRSRLHLTEEQFRLASETLPSATIHKPILVRVLPTVRVLEIEKSSARGLVK